ncbi:hypothetical protein [Acaryochloris sp. IP29b_bin.137]|uniref:hypothetical protein n=1 Tax=Acaryochloris sp. IP29b_bin.137 TaxID=2969217 RepID=UPI00263153AE|nr:hypothetical protein [Acaryochloris sp. IP29b_bin.137]
MPKLASAGITLNESITVENLLYSFSRQDYEAKPFDLLVFILGTEVEREPWGRPFCSRAWNFDPECIVQTGDYVKILQRLCKIADQPNVLSEVEDFVDIESGIAWLKYKVDNIARTWPIEQYIDQWDHNIQIHT